MDFDDDGDVPEFVTVVRHKDGTLVVDHSGLDADTVTALLCCGLAAWTDPETVEVEEP